MRHYLCKIEVVPGPRGRPLRRAAVARYSCNHAVVAIPLDAAGNHRFPWCIVVASATNYAAIEADPDIVLLAAPTDDDARLVDLPPAVRGRILATAARADVGVDLSALGPNATYGDVVDRLVRHQATDADWRATTVASLEEGDPA
jgi:hypothetical protein